MSLIDNLENMLASGNDSAMLRFGLGSAYFNEKRYADAIPHLQQCLAMDDNYTAAYKLLGRALHKQGREGEAQQILTTGLEKSLATGDKQTERELRVFLHKLQSN